VHIILRFTANAVLPYRPNFLDHVQNMARHCTISVTAIITIVQYRSDNSNLRGKFRLYEHARAYARSHIYIHKHTDSDPLILSSVTLDLTTLYTRLQNRPSRSYTVITLYISFRTHTHCEGTYYTNNSPPRVGTVSSRHHTRASAVDIIVVGMV